MLERIRVVLVNTSHPGNIGAAARAMKTMGLTQLVLVSPHSFPDQRAIEMSSHADDILACARVTPSLEEALAGCGIAIGTSARTRAISLLPLTPNACAEKLISTLHATPSDVAIVFGREHAGLTNEELLHCHYHVCIPSNPEYSSLNLAAAVQVLCYEVRLAFLEEGEKFPLRPPLQRGKPSHEDFRKDEQNTLANIEDVEQFYQHLQIVLTQLEFLKKENTTLMPKVRRLFNRVHLEKNEIHILRGMLTAVQKRRNNALSSSN
jgi:tRNA (cytidine32/uridine32-2'-O)-methyltransferase